MIEFSFSVSLSSLLTLFSSSLRWLISLPQKPYHTFNIKDIPAGTRSVFSVAYNYTTVELFNTNDHATVNQTVLLTKGQGYLNCTIIIRNGEYTLSKSIQDFVEFYLFIYFWIVAAKKRLNLLRYFFVSLQYKFYFFYLFILL